MVRAVESGDHRQMLVALRDRLFTAATDLKTHPRDIPGLTKELSRLAAELDRFDREEAESSLGGSSTDEPFIVSEL